MEIPLCGHATLVASKVLFNTDEKLQKIEFKTIQNIILKIDRIGDIIQIEFPVYQTKPATVPTEMLTALSLEKVKNTVFNEETNILLLEIDSCEKLQNLQPNFEALYKSHQTINGVLVTSLSNNKDYDFESRYFWPWSDTNKNLVTRGTHTFLAKYWSDKLYKNNEFFSMFRKRRFYTDNSIRF